MNHIGVVKWSFILSLIFISISSCGGGGVTESSGNPPAPVPQYVILSWLPVTENSDATPCDDLRGYRVYYGEQSPVEKSNSQMVDVGNTTSAQINNLLPEHTYYFRVASYDTSNNESILSPEEKSKTIN